jgi:hypothetical protein
LKLAGWELCAADVLDEQRKVRLRTRRNRDPDMPAVPGIANVGRKSLRAPRFVRCDLRPITSRQLLSDAEY